MSDASASEQLKEKLRVIESGLVDNDGKPVREVTLSSSDFASNAANREDGGKNYAPVSGEVKAAVPKAANADAMVATGATASSVTEKMVEGAPASSVVGAEIADSGSLFTTEEITIKEEDREAFIAAIISGKRFVRPFSVFGGAVTGKIRCRSSKESEAIAAWINKGLKEGRYASSLEYAVGVRNSLLAAQIMELNGVAYAELESPLMCTASKGVVEDPGWLASADAWSNMPEPVVAAVYDELRLFEKLYWTLVGHAADQNFWHPAEST